MTTTFTFPQGNSGISRKAVIGDAQNFKPNKSMPSAIKLIQRERTSQLKRYTQKHDDAHTEAELALAAVCYALIGADKHRYKNYNKDPKKCWPPSYWPFDFHEWSPKDTDIENLVVSGALILAEIERILRKKTP